MSDAVIIYNPRSGTGDHTDTVAARADLSGYAIEESGGAGEAVAMTREAVGEGYSTIVAGGGDGTVNEVVRGLDLADAFDDVTLGVLPLGTGNNFAKQIGVTDLDGAFTVLEGGERRRIDLSRANDRPFVNSCVAGVTAESSRETSADLKSRLGGLAYVLTTLQTAVEFDSLTLTIERGANDGATPTWSGDALCVLVGNGRRFTTDGSTQADMEDGRFEVAIVRDVAALDLMSDTVLERLLGVDSPHIDRFRAASVAITSDSPEPITYSLDGEIIQQRDLALGVSPRALRIAVGAGYEPHPTDE